MMLSRRRSGALGSGRLGSGRLGSGPSRREVLAGGAGAGALLALPVLAPGSSPGSASAASAASSGSAASSRSSYAFLFGVPESSSHPGGSFLASKSPASASSPPAPFQVASNLASAPVLSPDAATVAVATVETTSGGAKVTLTLRDKATAAVSKQGSLALADVPSDASILTTLVFAPGTTTVALVLAITVTASGGTLRKTDPRTGKVTTATATSWRSHHALAYFDSSSGAFTGPFDLSDEPSLALTTVAANGTDLFVWTTPEPQPADYSKASPKSAPLSTVSAFPLGSGKPRFSAPSLLPWPGGEPVVTLASGDIARLVHGRDVQVCSSRTGDITTHTLAPLNVARAKPSAVTMQARSDGTVFIAKPGIGTAIVADPANSFQVKSHVSFPAPQAPGSAPWSKAVLSSSGDTLYVVGGASSGGLSAYDVSTGTLTASYAYGSQHYAGLSVLPDGNMLAVGPAQPRLTFFSPTLSRLGDADTSLQIAAVF
jgi:hypothetical protein